MKNVAALLAGAGAVLLASAAAGIWWFESRWLPVFFTEDAVQVIAYAASDMLHENPATTDDAIAQMILAQHEASNINLGVDETGRAVDLFGTVFRVEYEVRPDAAVTTVTSAGPDREFGTKDDISFAHKRQNEPSAAKEGNDG
jgi:hypothetical protein